MWEALIQKRVAVDKETIIIQSIDGITTTRSNLYQDLDSLKSLLDARSVYFFELYAGILESTM